MILTTLGLFLMIFFLAIKNSFSSTKKIYNMLYKALLWNYIIRLVFEACIELTFVMILNTNLTDRIQESSNLLELMDYVYTMLFNALICLSPPFIIIFYNYHFDSWEADVFVNTYGTLYDGLQIKRSSIFYPFFFMIRRGIFALIARYAFNDAFLQLSTQLELTVFQLGYLLYFKPFDGHFA